jgi:hypothetical protein
VQAQKFGEEKKFKIRHLGTRACKLPFQPVSTCNSALAAHLNKKIKKIKNHATKQVDTTFIIIYLI